MSEPMGEPIGEPSPIAPKHRTLPRMSARWWEAFRERAHELGFAWASVCSPQPGARDAEAYARWLAASMHAEMGYMARPDRVARVLDPDLSLAGVRSIVIVGSPYRGGASEGARTTDPSCGLIASYARGLDYHDVMLPRLETLGAWIAEQLGSTGSRREMVDFGPLLERDAGRRAGLGFIGRNTMLIHPRGGSWSFLGGLLLDIDLNAATGGPGTTGGPATADAASGATGTCGRCTRCLDACPTSAFADEYVLDARKCISYLTIELKGPIPAELREGIGNRIFGCDVCNDVCPYNRQFGISTADTTFQPRSDLVAPELLDLLALDETRFRTRFEHTPLMRPKRRGLLRNVCVALGNWGDPTAAPGLTQALTDQEPLVRGHAAWALGQIGTPDARHAVATALRHETDIWVKDEMAAALHSLRR